MSRNIGILGRSLRYVPGLFLVTWGIAGGPYWAFVGLFLLASGAFGFCPFVYLSTINQSPVESDPERDLQEQSDPQEHTETGPEST